MIWALLSRCQACQASLREEVVTSHRNVFLQSLAKINMPCSCCCMGRHWSTRIVHLGKSCHHECGFVQILAAEMVMNKISADLGEEWWCILKHWIYVEVVWEGIAINSPIKSLFPLSLLHQTIERILTINWLNNNTCFTDKQEINEWRDKSPCSTTIDLRHQPTGNVRTFIKYA
jgi:hypothetical protein